MDNKKVPPQNSIKFFCKECNYTCFDRSNYNKHLRTLKHKRITKSTTKVPGFTCDCGRSYSYASGLSKHKLKCNFLISNELSSNPNLNNSNNLLDKENNLKHLIYSQQEQMKEQQKFIKEQQERHHKELAELIPRIGNTTNNNQKFNLQVFLNEDCKEAISWVDFIKSLELGVNEVGLLSNSDLTDSISTVICRAIQNLGIYRRPIHCIDPHRKKICIKDESKWNSDELSIQNTLSQTRNTIQTKYTNAVKAWEDSHPNWADNDKDTETYMTLLSKAVEVLDEKRWTSEMAKNSLIPKDSDNSNV